MTDRPGTPIRHIRLSDPLWKAARAKAHEQHTNVGAAVRAFLIAWTGCKDEGTKTREPDEAINATAAEIVRTTGPYAKARAAITGDSWLDDMARASVSAAEAKFTPPAAADEPAKRRKPAHRCPTKGWCETCGEWKGGK